MMIIVMIKMTMNKIYFKHCLESLKLILLKLITRSNIRLNGALCIWCLSKMFLAKFFLFLALPYGFLRIFLRSSLAIQGERCLSFR